GTYSAEQHPSHSFSYINSPYTVKLIAFGEHGCTDTVSVNSYISIAKPPAAAFDVLPDSIIKMPDYTFHFKNRSSADAVNFKWDFGNGKTSFEENPSYTYPDTGKYKVQLIAYNQEGCQDTLHKTVWVQGVPGYIFVPNAFEPGSGSRDLRTFKIKG